MAGDNYMLIRLLRQNLLQLLQLLLRDPAVNLAGDGAVQQHNAPCAEAEHMRLIALLMIPRAVKLLRDALKVLLEETPDGLNLDEVRTHLENIPHVVAVHDLHASTVSTGMPMLMAHVVVEPGMSMDQAANVLSQLQDCLREHFPVSVPHTTFQLEPEGYDSPSAGEMHR